MYMTISEIIERLEKAAELVQPLGSALEQLRKDPYPADLLHNQIVEMAAEIEAEEQRYSDEQDMWEAQNFG